MNSLSREFEIWQCLETYMFVTGEGGDAAVSYWIEARNAAAKTELDRTAPPSTRKELSASQMSVMLSLRNPASVFILPSVWSFLYFLPLLAGALLLVYDPATVSSPLGSPFSFLQGRPGATLLSSHRQPACYRLCCPVHESEAPTGQGTTSHLTL